MYYIQVHTIIHAIIHNLCDALTRLLQYLASFAECQHCKRNKIKVKFIYIKCFIFYAIINYQFRQVI